MEESSIYRFECALVVINMPTKMGVLLRSRIIYLIKNIRQLTKNFCLIINSLIIYQNRSFHDFLKEFTFYPSIGNEIYN